MTASWVPALRYGAWLLGCFIAGLTVSLSVIRLRQQRDMLKRRHVLGTWLFVASYLLLLAYVLSDIYPRIGLEHLSWRAPLATIALFLSVLSLLLAGWDDLVRIVQRRREP